MAQKKRIKPDAYKRSILTDDMEHCYLCGRDPVQIHHIFGGANRNLSTEMDMCCPLCWECHTNLHTDRNQQVRYRLMREAQDKWEMEYIGQHDNGTIQGYVEASHRARDEFRKLFGKSYL